MHTILGAGGPVANALTKELLKAGKQVRLVSRRPVAQFEGSKWLKADLKDGKAIAETVKGSEVIYVTAGLKYDKKVWAQEWPLIAQNLIDAAKSSNTRIIFFDNVYMYGAVSGAMTENTPYNPQSVKGEIRARVAEKMMAESKVGNINLTIARAPDFYGSESLNSFFDSMVLAKYAKGQKAMWLGNPDVKHAFTYIDDCGRAMYLLGQNASSGNQIWHMPTPAAISGREFMQLAADAYAVKPDFTRVNRLMLKALGIFTPVIGETAEMYYQYDRDYIFDSSKFEKAFGVQPVSYNDGFTALSKGLIKSRNV